MICGAVFAQQSGADSGSGDDQDRPPLTDAGEIFVLGNVTFALLHEFGHAVISDFEVPLLGLEENSADTIATVLLILLDRRYPDEGFSKALGVTALMQAYVWKTGFERDNGQVMLWAQHGLSAQRYARLVCLVYGSDSGRFGWLPEAAEMDDIRTEGCENEWRIAERAVRWLSANYGIEAAERSTRDAAGIDVKYGPALDAEQKKMLDLLQSRGSLRRLADFLQTRFAFPEAIALKLTRCRAPNAYWDPDYREVVLCYELMTAMQELTEDPEISRMTERLRNTEPRTGRLQKSSPARPLDRELPTKGVKS
jgi:hypothetical protein